MKIFFLLVLFLTTQPSFSVTINVCSRMHVSSLDPARAEDDISEKMLQLLDINLFYPDGRPTSLVKTHQFDQKTGTLVLELNETMKWQRANGFNPKKKFSASDIILTFNRSLTNKENFLVDQRDFNPFKMHVGQYIKSVSKISEHKVSIIFNKQNINYKELLAKPQAGIISHEYLLFLQRNGKLEQIEKAPLSFEGKEFSTKEQNNYTIRTGNTEYNFKLAQSLKKIKDCDVFLRISSNEAKLMKTLYGYHISEDLDSHEVWMIFNFQRSFNQELHVRKFVSNVLLAIETPGILKTYGAMPVKTFKEEIIIHKPSRSPVEVRKDLDLIKNHFSREMVLTHPENDEFFFTGGMQLVKEILDTFKQYKLSTSDYSIDDESYLGTLVDGNYDMALIDTKAPQELMSCFTKDLQNHPLRACTNSLNNKVLKDSIPAIPLYSFNYFDVYKTKDLQDTFK